MEYAGTFWAISGGENVVENKLKKGKWFTYGVTWAHKKTQFVFAMETDTMERKFTVCSRRQ